MDITNRYFAGMKVEVEIPLPDTKTFRDWAIINEIDEDLVSLQLSRDVLPDGVRLRIGQVLTIKSQRDNTPYTCRAYIVSKGYEHDLLLRFTSETTSTESREFYRVDAFIPVKFYSLYDQNPTNVKEMWETQRKLRKAENAARERRRLEAQRIKLRSEERARALNVQEDGSPAEVGTSPHVEQREVACDNQYYESWGAVTTLAVNISGGGLRIFTNEKFNIDELVLLEAYVPSISSIIDIIARVVFADYGSSAEKNKASSVAMQFVFIDEFARSAINTHISNIQLKRIRQFKGFTDVDPFSRNFTAPDKHYAYIDSIEVRDDTDQQEKIHRLKVQQGLLLLLLVGIICLLCGAFYWYSVVHPKNEIQDMFEKSIRKLQGN